MKKIIFAFLLVIFTALPAYADHDGDNYNNNGNPLPPTVAPDGSPDGCSVIQVASHGTSADNSVSLGSGEQCYGARAGNDIAYMGSGVDNAWGQTGNDVLHGENGQDSLYGGDGVDYITGGDGTDTLWGSDGGDTIYGNGDTGVWCDPGLSCEQEFLYGDGWNSLFPFSFDATVSFGNDTLYGGPGFDSIWGGGGDDTEWGDENRDHVHGGPGNDELHGGPAADHLRGDGPGGAFGDATCCDGNDLIWGDAGNDDIEGEGGDDTIRGGAGYDTIDGGTGYDICYLGGAASSGNDGEAVNCEKVYYF